MKATSMFWLLVKLWCWAMCFGILVMCAVEYARASVR
jgi:hypothetical protein